MSGDPACVPIDAVLAGPVAPFGAPGGRSAIAKTPVIGTVRVGWHGLEGDEQADLRHHGGPEKAVHHYARDHYAAWERVLAPTPPPVLAAPGAFGENLSTFGPMEADVCVGNLWRAGTALLHVSQARQPCFKLNHRFGLADMARRVQSSGRSGWYYRVLEPGTVAAGATLRLVERPHPDWPLRRLLRALYIDRMDRDALQEIVAIEALSPSWRALAAKRLERDTVEDWARRLDGERSASA